MSATSPTVRMPRHPGAHRLFPLAGLLAVLVAVAIAATLVVRSSTSTDVTGGGTKAATVDDRWTAKWAHAAGVAAAGEPVADVLAAVREAGRFNDRMAALGVAVRMDPFSGALHGGVARDAVRVMAFPHPDGPAATPHHPTARQIDARRA